MSSFGFEASYRGPAPAPWDIGRPQPEIVKLADAGAFQGRVLDVGCGTGENTIELARRGIVATGVDLAPTAIARAREKAKTRGLLADPISASGYARTAPERSSPSPRAAVASRVDSDSVRGSAEFVVHDALDLASLKRTFDAAFDTGVFHVFDDDDRPRFVASVATALRVGGRYFSMSMSDREPNWGGPRRVSKREIHDSFGASFVIDEVREVHFATNLDDEGSWAWLASMTKR
ncbi:MAG: class I SAM-dependent methyltransferase [Thermoplasmatota archaeon]